MKLCEIAVGFFAPGAFCNCAPSLSEARAERSRPAYARSLFTLLLLLALPPVVQAQFTFTTNNGSITLTGYTDPGGAVTIPSMTNGLPVANIADMTFSSGYAVTDLTIPETVTSISALAFYDCPGLSAITVDPLNPAYSSVDGVLLNLGQTMLIQCPGARTGAYTVPASVAIIGQWAFNWCFHLTNITIRSSVTNIPNSAFCACYSLTTIAVDSSNPKYSSLDGALFDKNGATLLYYPLNRDGNYEVPSDVISVTDGAFSGSSKLTAVVIGNNVTNIGRDAFYACGGLTNVVIGNSVTTIGRGAFLGCAALTSLTLGISVTSLGDGAFWSCTGLSTVLLPDSLTDIGGYAFKKCSGLTNLALGRNARNIGEEAFCYCNGLTTFTIPDSVVSIGSSAFQYCTSLTNLVIGTNVTNIGASAFRFCGKLTNVIIPNSVTNLGDWVFYGCVSLKTVAIPASVMSIGRAFGACDSLTNIVVDVLNPVYSSFDGVLLDKSRTTVIQCPEGRAGLYIIPDGVTRIETNGFSDCGKLTMITVPDSVTTIGALSFAYCNSLTNVALGKSVRTIETDAFYSCTALTTVTIPASVTTLGSSAFAYAYRLTQVYFQGGTPAGDFGVFYDTQATIYYLPGTPGWGSTFGGRPTSLWFLPNPLILSSSGFRVQTNGFGFVISWATNLSVVVEACTELGRPIWSPVSTNTLTAGAAYFTDPQWTNYPSRLYRVRSL